jgi:hypothetical protein
MFRFDRIGVGLHRPGSAKSSASAQRFSSGLEPPELPCAVRRVLKKTIRQDLCFLSCSARRFSSGGDMRRPRSCPAPGGGCWSPGDTCQPGAALSREVGTRATGTRGAPRAALRGPGVAISWEVGTRAAGTRGTRGAALHRDTRRPRSCPAPGGGCWLQSCPKPVYCWLFLVISS